jgi:hypothetical protein
MDLVPPRSVRATSQPGELLTASGRTKSELSCLHMTTYALNMIHHLTICQKLDMELEGKHSSTLLQCFYPSLVLLVVQKATRWCSMTHPVASNRARTGRASPFPRI